MNSSEQVAADAKEILYEVVHRCEALQLGGRLEPAHLALAMANGLMGDFCSIVLYCRVLWITDGITVWCAAK